MEDDFQAKKPFAATMHHICLHFEQTEMFEIRNSGDFTASKHLFIMLFII